MTDGAPSSEESGKRQVGFPPIVGRAPRILVLGSMPGEASLRRQEYYGHPRNAFWYIMAHLTGVAADAPYAERTRALCGHGVALWDVLHACKRKGSLDADILTPSIEPNDLQGFLADQPCVARILFNGTRAANEFHRRVLPTVGGRASSLALVRLPSTSPAMATLTREQKLAKWMAALQEQGAAMPRVCRGGG